MNIPHNLIQKRKEINEFIKSITPQLIEISTKQHRSLTEISHVAFDEDGISFTAGGYCMGWFEDVFEVKWENIK